MPACKICPVIALGIPQFCGRDCPVPYSLSGVGITQSLLGSFQTCRRRFLFDINRWCKPDAALKFEYGNMNHEILDKVYTGFRLGNFGYDDLVDVITDAIDKYTFTRVWSDEAIEIAKAKSQAVMECYIIVFKTDFTEMRFEEVEGVFEITWCGFKLRGKKDGRFRDKNGGGWHIEHKNYGYIQEDILPMLLSFDLQNLLYMLVDQIEFMRLLKGVLYNILRNPQVRKKDGGPNDVYMKLKKDIMADPRHYFIRYEIPYMPSQLKQFEAELFEKLTDLNSILQGDPGKVFNRMYKNEHACESPYRCDFINACATGNMIGYVQSPNLFEELQVIKC
jgi:hypothetical protein